MYASVHLSKSASSMLFYVSTKPFLNETFGIQFVGDLDE
jgi:hypothetical protein